MGGGRDRSIAGASEWLFLGGSDRLSCGGAQLKRLVLALTAVCLCQHTPAQDLAQQGLPTSLLRVFEKAESDLRRNREEYAKANEKTLAEFNKTVKKEVDRLSKAGKPEEALALKDSAEAWFQQAMGGGEQGAVPQMPVSPDEKRKNPNGRVRLVDGKPTGSEGVVAIEAQHGDRKPLINGRPTTEPFIHTTAPATVVWDIPEGKKWFRTYAYYFPDVHPAHQPNAVMEVRIDGKTVVRTIPLTVENRLFPIEVKIPPGSKTLTLVSLTNGDPAHDECVWAEPCFYDR